MPEEIREHGGHTDPKPSPPPPKRGLISRKRQLVFLSFMILLAAKGLVGIGEVAFVILSYIYLYEFISRFAFPRKQNEQKRRLSNPKNKLFQAYFLATAIIGSHSLFIASLLLTFSFYFSYKRYLSQAYSSRFATSEMDYTGETSTVLELQLHIFSSSPVKPSPNQLVSPTGLQHPLVFSDRFSTTLVVSSLCWIGLKPSSQIFSVQVVQ